MGRNMDEKSNTSLSIYFKKAIKGVENADRARLDFAAVEKNQPELANLVRIVRSRARILKTNFEADAEWALANFTKWTILSILVTSLLFFWMILTGTKFDSASAWIAALATLPGIFVLSFGWHKRYGALLGAKWAMLALTLRVDHEILWHVHLADPASGMSTEDKANLRKSVDGWMDEITRILGAFGTAYGAAIEPATMKMPKFG